MFDPFFPLLLLGGPVLLGLMLWIEARRRTSFLRPRGETYLLGFVAAFALSQWLTLLAVNRYGEGMTEEQFNLLALLSFVLAGFFVAGTYTVVALIRRRREIGN